MLCRHRRLALMGCGARRSASWSLHSRRDGQPKMKTSWREHLLSNLDDITRHLPVPRLLLSLEDDAAYLGLPSPPATLAEVNKGMRHTTIPATLTFAMQKRIDEYLSTWNEPIVPENERTIRRMRQLLCQLEKANGFGRSVEKQVKLALPEDLARAIGGRDNVERFIKANATFFTIHEDMTNQAIRANRHLELAEFIRLFAAPNAEQRAVGIGDDHIVGITKAELHIRAAMSYMCDDYTCAWDEVQSHPEQKPNISVAELEEQLRNEHNQVRKRSTHEFLRKRKDPVSRGFAPANHALYFIHQKTISPQITSPYYPTDEEVELRVFNVVHLAVDALSVRNVQGKEAMRRHLVKLLAEWERWMTHNKDLRQVVSNHGQWRMRLKYR